MLSCFLDICRIFLCCEDEEKQERSSSDYGGYYSPLQRESSLKRSPAAEAYTYTPSRKASSRHGLPSAAPTCFLSSSLAYSSKISSSVSEALPPLSKPSSSSLVSSKPYSSSAYSSSCLTHPSTASLASAAPAKRQSEPSSSALASSKGSSSSPYSSSSTPLTAISVPPSPVKPRSPHAALACAKASPLSEPSSFSLAKISSLSSSFLTPPLIASFACPSPVKAQSPHAASAGAKTLLLSNPSSSSLAKASSASSSFSLTPPLTASSAPLSLAKAQPPHAASTSAKALWLSEPYSSPSLVSLKAYPSASSSSSSLTPSSAASFAPPSPVKAQPPHAASTGAQASPLSEPYSSPYPANTSSASSSFLTPSLTASFASPSPAKPQSPHAASAGAKTSPLLKPSSSSVVSSKAAPSSPSSSSVTPPLTASCAPPSPAKAQPPHAPSAGANGLWLSEPYSSLSLVSSKADSSSSSSLTPATASSAPPSTVKAQSPHAELAGPKASLQWKAVSSKASSSSSSSLAPSLTASFASPSPAQAQPPHAKPAGAKASQLSESSSPSLVSSKAASSSSSSSTPSTASFAPPPVKAQSPHAASTGPKALLQWKAVSSKASSSSSSSLAPSLTASFASPSPAKAQPPHAKSAGAKVSQLSEPSSPSLFSSKAASSSSSSSTLPAASFASPSPLKARSPHAASASGSPARAWTLSDPSSPSSVSSKASSSSSSSLAPSTASFASSPQFDQLNKIGQLPRYEIPKHMQEQIKNDVVPKVLRKPLSPSTYADYFAALLYAEDYYCEKWSDFILLDVTLELREKGGFKIQNSTGGKKNNKSNAQKDKPFVAFEIDSVPENRPYLISRDHVLAQPAGKQIEPFQGIFFRVEKSKWMLAEFEDSFHEQHSPSKRYDVSFSFNRVCLKRSHHAVSAAMDPFLCNILFPDPPHITFLGPVNDFNFTQNDRGSAVIAITSHILNLHSPQPYLLEGPLSETPLGDLSEMGNVIHLAILQLYRTCSSNRILVCAPRNRTLDALTKRLLEDIPESRIFRANAAFREDIPDDIMPVCSVEGECFTCPPLAELEDFRVVTSTFISTFRLKAAGIGADHFSHIFLVDASSSTEPETIVALANLVGKTTAVVVTGSLADTPSWVRSDMARRNGLKKSFFRRLLEMESYCLSGPTCFARVYGGDEQNGGTMILPSTDTHGFGY